MLLNKQGKIEESLSLVSDVQQCVVNVKLKNSFTIKSTSLKK